MSGPTPRARAPRALSYGESATFVDLACDDAPDRAARTHAVAVALRAAWPDADVVLGAGALAVVGVAPDAIDALRGRAATSAPPARGRLHSIAAVYDGPDLDEVASSLGCSRADVIARHAEPEYLVELVGFMPGFAYLSAPSFALRVPRRPAPRPRVPAGSIGIAASFTGIYPFASPGGWNLIARARDAVLFDPQRAPPGLFEPGDRVRFVPSAGPLEASPASPEPEPSKPSRGLRVVAAPACATVQDGGRPGLLGHGIPPSGPLDAEALAAANVAVGNLRDAAAIEVPLGSLEVEAIGGARVSVDGARWVLLAPGERCRVSECERAVRYLAVEGGIDVPSALGARATLLSARVGGHRGRALQRGDVLAIGRPRAAAPGPPSHATEERSPDEALVVDPGPHVDRFPPGAYEALLGGSWRVSRHADRVGVRLEGARVPREGPDLALPVPMIRGAIEITTDGTPIVLGPDHPTTGGYPVLAVLRASSRPALARRRPGAALCFVDGGKLPAR